MRIICPVCRKSGYLRLIAKDRTWNEITFTSTIQFEIRVDHDKLSCQLGPYGEVAKEMAK